MRRTALIVLALAVAVGGPLLAAALGDGDGSGGAGGERAAFAWQAKPLSIEPEAGLPEDRILMGELRNTALRAAELDTDRVRVLDGRGRPMKTAVRFAHTFAHGIYSAEMVFRQGPAPEAERRRLGELVTVRPGATVPVTVSWRGAGAATIDLDGAAVRIP